VRNLFVNQLVCINAKRSQQVNVISTREIERLSAVMQFKSSTFVLCVHSLLIVLNVSVISSLCVLNEIKEQ